MFTALKSRNGQNSSRAIANNIRKKSLGNSGLKNHHIQTKLTIGKPNDKYEQEADRVADRIMSMPEPIPSRGANTGANQEEIQTKPLFPTITPCIQRQPAEKEDEEIAQPKFMVQRQAEEEPVQMKCEECEKEEKLQRQDEEKEELAQTKLVQKQEEDEEPIRTNTDIQKQDVPKEEEDEPVMTKPNNPGLQTASSIIEGSLKQSKGQGSPLSDEPRSFMENRFSTDFGKVLIHNDSNAIQMNKQLHAQAFTKGNDIYFNRGKYNPGSSLGKHLLAHELTHVVQQTGRTNQGENLYKKISTRNSNTIQRLMGFEYQTNNKVTRVKRGKRKNFTRVQSKNKPLRSAGKGLKMEVDTGSVIEFVTSPYDKWSDLKVDVKAAQDIVTEIKSLKKRLKRPRKPLSKNNPELYIGFKSNYGPIDVNVDPNDFRAKPQSTEGVVLSEYETLLKEHDKRKSVGRTLVLGKAAKIRSSQSSKSADLKGFIQIIIHTILQAQRTGSNLITTSSGKIKQPKAFFRLMTRIDFASMYRSLSSSDQATFAAMIKAKPNQISLQTGLAMTDDLFKVGYWGIHPKKRYGFKVLLKEGKIEMIKKRIKGVKGAGKFGNIHNCGAPGVPARYCRGKAKRVTLESWLNSIIAKGTQKDLLSPLPTYSGTKHGGYSMGLWNVKTPGVFPFEMRGYPGKKVADWLTFTEKKFEKAAKTRPGSKLIYP